MATTQIPQGEAIIGAAVPRIDGPLKTTGTARYSLDRSFPNLAHGVLVESTIGKGRIRSLDASVAETMPGVLLVLHHGNLENVYRTFPREQDGSMAETRPPFYDDQIYYWGQYVAAVVAETLEQAQAAAAAIRIEYDAETPDVRTDLSAGYDGTRESSWKRGDPDQALSSAPVVVDETYVTPIETHNPMEMHSTVAVWDGDNVTLYDGSQGVVAHRTVMSEVLGVPRENVRTDFALYRIGIWRQTFSLAAMHGGRGGSAPAQSSGKAQCRPAHDVHRSWPSSAHATAHSPRRYAAMESSPRSVTTSTAKPRCSTTLWNIAASKRRSSIAVPIS